jgi:hypothetical protein
LLYSTWHWQGLTSTWRQAWELISGPCPAAKTRLLSCNRTQSRVVTGLLTGYNTLRWHFYITELTDSPLCTRCGAEKKTSAHVLCECEALATLRHTYLGSFFLDPEDLRNLSLGAIWNFIKGTGLPWLCFRLKRHKEPVKMPTCIGTEKGLTHYWFCSKVLVVFLSVDPHSRLQVITQKTKYE